jgi:hypothetical protein
MKTNKAEKIFYSIVALWGVALVVIQVTRYIIQNYGG